MHAHALRKGTGAYGHFCPSPLLDAPSVYPTPCGHRQRDWATPTGSRKKYLSCTKKSVSRRAMIPGEIFTRFAEFQGIVSVNDSWLPIGLQKLLQASLSFL